MKRLEPLIRAWVADFRLAEVKAGLKQLEQWLRRRLRCILWRQWQRPRTRAKRLMRLGLERQRAYTSADNGHGPRWHAGGFHMKQGVGLVASASSVSWAFSKSTVACNASSEPPWTEP